MLIRKSCNGTKVLWRRSETSLVLQCTPVCLLTDMLRALHPQRGHAYMVLDRPRRQHVVVQSQALALEGFSQMHRW